MVAAFSPVQFRDWRENKVTIYGVKVDQKGALESQESYRY